MSSVEEAQNRFYQAESDVENLKTEFDIQTSIFGQRAAGYLDDAYSFSFDGDEFDPKTVKRQIKRPREIQRADLVEGIQHARKFKGLARLEASAEISKKLKNIQARFEANPFMNSQPLVTEYGRLLTQHAEAHIDSPRLNAQVAEEEEQMASMIREFDQKSISLVDEWESDLKDLTVLYSGCTELKESLEKAKRDLEEAENAMHQAEQFADEPNF